MAGDPLSLIANRRREIDAERLLLRQRLDEIDGEIGELEVAERVVAKLTGIPVRDDDEEVGGGKPDNTPTIPEMVLTVLNAARGGGLPGMEPKAVLARIQDTWWPTARSEGVSSIMWRMWKRGQLDKDGAVYRLPFTNEAVGTAPDKDAPTASAEDGPARDLLGPSTPDRGSQAAERQVVHDNMS